MAIEQSLHMNHGEGEASYARNSSIQSTQQNRMRPIIEEAVSDLLTTTGTKSPTKVAIADLGCSSGPNALALVSNAVDAIIQHYARQQKVPPELCVFLNDLPDSDFNTVAKNLDQFQESEQSAGYVTVGIVPGSFYKRLFPRSSLHLIFASHSAQWLSKAPEDLRTKGIPMYDGDDDLRRARQPLVMEAYSRQFKKDFKLFLSLRAQELIPGGQMVISVPSPSDNTCQSNVAWHDIAFTLNDMAARGVIEREKMDSFYIPMHTPSDKEVKDVIEEEGSFKINKLLMHKLTSGMDKSSLNPRVLALAGRALSEPMMVQHFGKSDHIAEEFVRTMERHLIKGSLQSSISSIAFLCVALTKIM